RTVRNQGVANLARCADAFGATLLTLIDVLRHPLVVNASVNVIAVREMNAIRLGHFVDFTEKGHATWLAISVDHLVTDLNITHLRPSSGGGNRCDQRHRFSNAL